MSLRIGKARLLKVAIAATALLAACFITAQTIERKMKSDAGWMPPQVQIQAQSRMLGAERNAAAIADEEFGFALPPDLEQAVSTIDFEVNRKLDSHGFPNAIAWPGRADIVFLGDSFLLGEGVGVENGFVALLNEKLSDRVVLNLSLPGAGLKRQARVLQRYGRDLAPGLVVACLALSYDLLNDVHFSAWLDESLGKPYNQFRLSYTRRANKEHESELMSKLRRRALYSWFLSKSEPLLREPSRVRHSVTMRDGQELLFDREKVLFAKREFAASDEEVQQLDEGLNEISLAASLVGAELLVVLLPSKEELFAIHDGAPQGNVRAIAHQALGDRGIPFIDLYDSIRTAAEQQTPFFKADIHYNQFGNEAIARELAGQLLESFVFEDR